MHLIIAQTIDVAYLRSEVSLSVSKQTCNTCCLLPPYIWHMLAELRSRSALFASSKLLYSYWLVRSSIVCSYHRDFNRSRRLRRQFLPHITMHCILTPIPFTGTSSNSNGVAGVKAVLYG
eukprot:scaffold202297_cov52-Prasinocladus_malaysianus.AAC.1